MLVFLTKKCVLTHLTLITSLSLFSVLMWRMDCQWDAAPWTPRPALALVWSCRPTFPIASGGNPSSTALTLTLTFHPKVLPGTLPLPVTCKFTSAVPPVIVVVMVTLCEWERLCNTICNVLYLLCI